MSAKQALEKTESDQGGTTNPAHRRRLPVRQTLVKGAVAFIIVVALVAPWEASTGSDCALLLPPGREGVARSNTDAVLADIYVQPGDTIAEGAKIARLSNPNRRPAYQLTPRSTGQHEQFEIEKSCASEAKHAVGQLQRA